MIGWVYRDGVDPDPRFTLANERTFLAWIRTALALVAGGVALEALGLPLHPGLRLAASLLLLGAGLIIPVLAWIGWGRAERAMRRQTRLPAAVFALPLAIVLTAATVLIVLGLLFV
ncbi:YidH family protein [Microbacterium sp. ZW CA_36]|uniref:YidH family protein n=1 Tax=Microbacterium sp. ZW CA_36 TaxID=3378078 RepID=UPI00385357DD